ncbi:MAG TPA: hypothetical protein VFS14_05080 [Candidatus Saccharimonadales bacterium]|nr:hypothetical protein [Candidatus Saccharimonadales bacterium]
MKDYGTIRRHVLAVPFELVMLGGAVGTFMRGDQLHLLTSVFTFCISFLPLVLERRLRVRIPMVIQTVYVAFIFASMFAGEVFGLYGQIWPWDDWMHFISGVLISVGVVMWLTILKDRGMKLPSWLQSYMILASAAFVAVLWELAEFASDQLFGTFSQGADLTDTMLDLLYDVSGAVIVAVAWRLASYRDTLGLRRLATHFLKLQR